MLRRKNFKPTPGRTEWIVKSMSPQKFGEHPWCGSRQHSLFRCPLRLGELGQVATRTPVSEKAVACSGEVWRAMLPDSQALGSIAPRDSLKAAEASSPWASGVALQQRWSNPITPQVKGWCWLALPSRITAETPWP